MFENKMNDEQKMNNAYLNSVSNVVNTFIKEHDEAFEKNHLQKCFELEKIYDKKIESLGFDPVNLHEFIVEYDSVEKAVQSYAQTQFSEKDVFAYK